MGQMFANPSGHIHGQPVEWRPSNDILHFKTVDNELLAESAAAAERPRTERIAFRTRTEIEILDDGYKWRKYGKKSVKNSPNPRNYYRCSTEGCSVKERVGGDRDDPAYVVTTYEGTHSHVSPSTVYYASQDAASGRFFVAGTHPPPGSLN
uniref:Uncharacterized protein n=1 Tax=Aegilops tauschii TaxID=37682 RepID=M8CZ47_AEGTA